MQKVFYHKLCRTRFLNPSKVDNSAESRESASKIFTRSKSSKIDFDWKNNCFICGDKCEIKKRGTWSIIQSSIDTSSNLYRKIFKAAEVRNDELVLSRLLSCNEDLVAVEARYHRKKGCLAHYISEKNISSFLQEPVKSSLAQACDKVINEFTDVIINQLGVVELSKLKTFFDEVCAQNSGVDGPSSAIKSNYFKQLLSKC